MKYKKEERILYSELREKAIADGVNDNITAIGRWIKKNGWVKRQSRGKDKESYYYYVRIEDIEREKNELINTLTNGENN